MPMTCGPEQAVSRARAAQAEFESWSQEQVDELISGVGWNIYREDNVRRLSELAFRETRLGNPEDLFGLHRKRVLGTLRDMYGVRTVGLVEEIPELGIARFAKPVGVVGVACSATAPCSCVATTALQLLKTRNSVVFSPNPRAQLAAEETVRYLRDGLTKVGAPVNLVQCVHVDGRNTTEALMRSVDLVVAVGGPGTVRRAYESGTPAISSGAGNPSVIVDSSADIQDALSKIVQGACINNGTSCSSESNILVDGVVGRSFVRGLEDHGVHLCSDSEADRLRSLLWPDGHRLNRDAIGRGASRIAAEAQIELVRPRETRALAVYCDTLSVGEAFFGEKLSPVFSIHFYNDFDEALSAIGWLIDRQGKGHSCGIYTSTPGNVSRLAERVKVARVMVNQSTAIGNTGSFSNGMPFTSIVSTGTWGGCSHSENITWRHFLNYTVVSREISCRMPDEREMFGGFLGS